MTEALTETPQEATTATKMSPDDERLILVREFPVELAEGDGRTIEARIIPYNTPAMVADAPTFKPYREAFLPGAFQAQTRAADRVKIWLNFEHEQGLRGIVGHGVSLVDSEQDLRGSFRVHDNADGDKALQMVRDGLLTGLSVEFAAIRSRKVDGVVQRLRAHLDKVSLCRQPAYPTAQVLAVREAPDEQPFVVAEVPALDHERLARFGIEPLFRQAVVSTQWNGDAARFTDAEYQASCLIDRGGTATIKERCSLPVLEPNGDLNTNALGPAAGSLRGARGGIIGVTAEQKAAAARKLVRYYRLANLQPPAGVARMAG